MNFIKKIFENKIDEDVHRQFTKFGPGTFENKALLDITLTAKAVKIKSSPEFANEFVKLVAEKLGENSTKVTGAIVSTRKLNEEPEFSKILENAEVKQFQGVKRFLISEEMTGTQILNFLEKTPNSFFGLTFNVDDIKLKIKPKAPKSAKPGKGDDKPKADFCTLTYPEKDILEDYAFDIKDSFKKAFILHTIQITEIIVPEEYKDNFAQARIHAKRKGILTRKIEVDGKQSESKTEFLV